MFCSNCGKECKEDATFCDKCGKKIKVPGETAEGGKSKEKNKLQIFIIALAIVFIVVFGVSFLLISLFVTRKQTKNGDLADAQKVEQSVVEADEEMDVEALDTKQEEQKQEDLEAKVETKTGTAEDEWRAAYSNYLNQMPSETKSMYVAVGLIYVNDDDVPEIVLEGDCEATGYLVLTYGNGQIDELYTSRLCLDYIERKNLLRNGGGHMGYYYDFVYEIKDGKWNQIAGGEFGGDGDESTYTYQWEEKDVSEAEYNANLRSVYNVDAAVWPNNLQTFTEFESSLETGQSTSANHRYEFYVADVTWTQAEELCRSKGGYLATITSRDELEKITKQMCEEGKEKVTFYIGATRDENYGGDSMYHWVHDQENEMMIISGAFADFWLPGEPSYQGEDVEGNSVEEQYVDLFYRSSDGRCYLNDVVNDILQQAPGYAGKIGYICEFE